MDEINQRGKNIKEELKEPEVSENARYIAETRYAIKDEDGKTTEKVRDIFYRVAESIAKAEGKFGGSEERIKELTMNFYNLLAEQKFFPNTPCLVNAGRAKQQLSA